VSVIPALPRSLHPSASRSNVMTRAALACSRPSSADGNGRRRLARILVVEDDRNVGVLMVVTLRSAGHAVDIARNAAAARLRMHLEPYELVLADVRLPDRRHRDRRRDQGARRRGTHRVGLPAATAGRGAQAPRVPD
jgi:hypothetical protein